MGSLASYTPQPCKAIKQCQANQVPQQSSRERQTDRGLACVQSIVQIEPNKAQKHFIHHRWDQCQHCPAQQQRIPHSLANHTPGAFLVLAASLVYLLASLGGSTGKRLDSSDQKDACPQACCEPADLGPALMKTNQ